MPLRAVVASTSIAFLLPLVLCSSSPVRAAEPAPAPPPPDAAPEKVVPRAGDPEVWTSASPPTADSLPPPPKPSTGVAGPEIELATGDGMGGNITPRDPATEGPRLALGAGGHVTFGAAPAVSIGATLAAEIGNTRWSMGIEGRYDAPASGHTTQGATARASLLGASFVPCIRAQGTWACGVVLVSRVEASASDATTPTVRDSFLFLGLGGRLQMHFGLPLGFALRVAGELLAHPFPYELRANNQRLFRSFVVSTTLGPSVVRAF